MIQFAYTILYVNDVEATLSFYEKAFELERKFLTPEKNYGELQTGATTLSFASFQLANTNFSGGFIESSSNSQPLGVEIAFTTENVENTFNKAVINGAIPVEKATQKPWGQTVAYVKDINGFLIEICTPVS